MYKTLGSVVTGLTLTGCLATADLASDGNTLSNSERLIVAEMVAQAQQVCTVTSFDPAGAPIGGRGMKLAKPPIAKSFFSSSSGWYKALMQQVGVWDEVFYHPSSNTLICGQKLWQTTKESKSVVFAEVGVEEKSAFDLVKRGVAASTQAYVVDKKLTDWTHVFSNNVGQHFFIDTGNVSRTAEQVYFRIRISSDSEIKNSLGTFKSLIISSIGNCKRSGLTLTDAKLYDDLSVDTEPSRTVTSRELLDFAPNSALSASLDVACGRANRPRLEIDKDGNVFVK